MASENKGSVGIQIDSRTITVVQARLHAGRVEVVSRGAANTPVGALDGSVIRDPHAVAEVIRGLLKEMNLRPKTASVALTPFAYSMRTIRLPDVPVPERSALVRNELEETGALPPRSGTVGFLWLPAPHEPGKRLMDAYTYYTGDAEVDHLRETLRLAAIQMAQIEPSSIAMIRAYIAAQTVPGPIAVLCLARKHADLCIHDGRSVRTMRRLAAGSDDIVQAPRDQMTYEGGGPEHEPRHVPVNFETLNEPEGVRPTDFDLGDVQIGSGASVLPSDGAVPAPLQASADASFLASEVARSLAFFAREFPDVPRPQMLAVIAPHAIVPVLQPLLASALTIPIKADDPLDSFDMPRPVTLPPGVLSEGYLPAIGVALEGAETSVPIIDLSQQQERVKAGKRAPAMLLAGMAGSTLWMIAAAFASIALTILESDEQTDSARTQHEIERIKAERAPILKKAEIYNAVKAVADKSRVPVSSVLGRVAAATPPGIMLTRVAVGADGKVTIEGSALNTINMEEFANSLRHGVSIKSPGYEMLKKDEKGITTFRIAGTTRGAAPP